MSKIPNGWHLFFLEECAEIILSNVDKKSRAGERSVLLCNYMDVYQNDIIDKRLDFMKATATDGQIEKFALRKNDVLITKDSETPEDIARAAVVSENIEMLLCGYHLAILRPREPIHGPFLCKTVQSDKSRAYWSSRAGGATRFGLTSDSILKAPVLLPPLPEQKKIAEILTAVDDTIESTRQVIDQTKKVKQGLLQELLTKGIGHKKFKDTEIGRIPVEWEVVRLGDHIDVLSGKGFKLSEYVPEGVKLLRIDNVSYGKVEWSSVAFLPLSYVDEFPNLVLYPDDILLALNRPITQGKLKIARLPVADAPCILYQRVGKIVSITDRIRNDFSFHLLGLHIKKFVELTSVGSDQPFISVVALRDLPIGIPPLHEQKQIAAILSSVDDQITAQEKELAQLQTIKKGLMQDLLTGKVRVKV